MVQLNFSISYLLSRINGATKASHLIWNFFLSKQDLLTSYKKRRGPILNLRAEASSSPGSAQPSLGYSLQLCDLWCKLVLVTVNCRGSSSFLGHVIPNKDTWKMFFPSCVSVSPHFVCCCLLKLWPLSLWLLCPFILWHLPFPTVRCGFELDGCESPCLPQEPKHKLR